MSETTPEPNTKPAFARFDQNLAFFVMVLACAAVTFIKLDDLIGAAGMDGIAMWNSAGVSLVLLFITTIVLIRWKFLTGWAILPGIVLLYVIFFYAVCISASYSLMGSPNFANRVILPLCFVAAGCLLLMAWWTKIPLSSRFLVAYTLSILCLSAGYLFGNSIAHGAVENATQASLGGHHYVLNRDDYMVILYDCNRYAFNCHSIYETEANIGVYWKLSGAPAEIKLEDETVRLYVNDELWFEHNP